MPSLSASISSGCQVGAGVLTLSAVNSAAPQDSAYFWSVVSGKGVEFGSPFDPAELPLVTSGLPNDTYSTRVTATAPAGGIVYASIPRSFVIACGPPLVLKFATPTPATATGGGTITVGASGGANPLTATIVELGLSQQLMPDPVTGELSTKFLNIPAGTYTVRVADAATPPQQAQATVVVDAYVVAPVLGCTDPAADNYDPNATQDNDSCVYAPPVRQPYFDVPKMQSLRYVLPGGPAFDNTLLADETPLDYTVAPYCQLVEQGDTLVLQALSNYQGAPVLTIRRRSDDAVVLTVPGVKVQTGAGQTASFEVYLKPDPLPGFTRIYFNEDALPLPFLPGQRVTISGTGTGLDRTYPLHDVLEDAAAAVPYLRVVGAFPSGNIRMDGSLTTTYLVQQYDTYQFVVPFDGVPEGCFYSQITAIDTDFAAALAVSEPIEVGSVHQHTKVISYRNFDNAFGLNYSHGLVNRQRVMGRFFDRRPTGEKTVLRNDDSELVLLSASVYGKIYLETLLLPAWLHEVLFVAFAHDFVRINEERVVLESEYTYEPVERYTLGKGTALLERHGFLGAGNRDDVGDTLTGKGPFLLANQKFLKVNR